MNERDLIATQTIKQVSEGGDAVRADLKATASAQDQLAASAGNLATVTETSARRQTSAAAAFNAMARSKDVAARAAEDVARTEAVLGRAMSQNASILDKAGQGLGIYVRKLDEARVAAEALRRQQANASVNQGAGFSPGAVNASTYAAMFGGLLDIAEGKARQTGQAFGAALDASMIAGTAKSARDSAAVFTAEMERVDEIARHKAQQIGKNFQDGLNQSFGIGGSSKSARDSAAVFEEAARGQDAMAASATKLRAAINPLEAEQGRLAAELRGYKQALDAGAISQKEFAAAHAMAGKRLGDFAQNLKTAGTAGRVMSGELVNMGYQLNDVVTGLALGQSPFMIIAQQGGQVVQILQNSRASVGEFAKTMASSIASGAMAIATPINAAIAGVVALTAAAAVLAVQWDKVQISSQRAITGAGQRTGTTTSDLNAFVNKNTPSSFSGSTLSQKESRALGEGLTQTGDIVISKLQSMSAAVVGFSNQTGQSMDESVKAFAKMGSDPVKAMDALAGAFGPFSQNTRTLVQDMVAAGDKTLAWNAILNELGPTAKGTAGNLEFGEKAVRALSNALQIAPKPTGLEKQLEDVRQKLNGAIEAANQFSEHGVAAPPEASNSIAALSKQFEGLYARQQAVIGLKVSATFDDIAEKARVATEALIPQIQQLREMELRLNQLKEARDKGAGGPNNDAAIIAQQNLIAKTQEAQAEAARYNTRVAEISKSWGEVGQSTALALEALKNQLPVAQAVTGQAQMQAQYYATIKDLIDAGKTGIEAQSTAYAQLAVSQASATASVERQTIGVRDQLALYRAQQNGDTARVASAIAYRNAMESGADSSAASALASATFRLETEKAFDAAQNLAKAWEETSIAANTAAENAERAASAARGGAFSAKSDGSFDVPKGTQYTSTSNAGHAIARAWGWSKAIYDREKTQSELADSVVGQRGSVSDSISATMKSGMSPQYDTRNRLTHNGFGYVSGYASFGLQDFQSKVNDSDTLSTLGTLYDLKNAQTDDKSQQIANLNEFLAYVQTMPETIARDQKIVDLYQSIKRLTESTDANTAATEASLNPLYSQGHGALAIGYYKAATGLEGIVQGSGGVDSVPISVMATPGEHFKFTPPGEISNDNSKSSQTTIIQNFYGETQDNRRRSRRQAEQGFAQSMAAIG